MKRKNLGIVMLLLATIALAVVVYKKYQKAESGTLDEESKEFAYQDTAAITRIFIADKRGKTADLTRGENGVWVINGKHVARSEAVISILKCLKYLEVKRPVGEKAKPHVIKDLAASGIKAEFYSGSEPVRIFYVGGETQDHTGTFMLLVNHETGENYDQPYVMGLPGFEGYLTPRFFINESEWRDTKVIDFRPNEITEVILDIPSKPDSSFMIRLHDTKTFDLLTTKGQPVNFKPDVNAMKQYLAYLQNIHYEKLLDPSNDKVADSIRNSSPFAVLMVNDKKGKQHQVQFYHRKISEGQKQKYGIEGPYDPDRLYIEFDDRKSMALAQFYVFGKLLQTRQYFMPRGQSAVTRK